MRVKSHQLQLDCHPTCPNYAWGEPINLANHLAVHPLFWQRFTEDFGGAVLAAQWRAAVKEVQKPFVMPD